jgi:hypothetical protein
LLNEQYYDLTPYFSRICIFQKGALMTTCKLRRLASLTVCTAFVALHTPVQAQTTAYPDKPVRIIVPFPPGGAAVKLTLASNTTPEYKYIVGTIPDAGMANARIDCMNGNTADRRIEKDGVMLNPAKICMAWMERASENELVIAGGWGMMSPYRELASRKRFADTPQNAKSLFNHIVNAMDDNASSIGPLVLKLRDDKALVADKTLTIADTTLNIATARAYDAGYVLAFESLRSGNPLPTTTLEKKTPEELENYVMACINNKTLNFGTCKAVGLEHARRVVIPATGAK